MKKYVLYPGLGRALPTEAPQYLTAALLATRCYRVPMSECLNMDDPFIRKVAAAGSKFDHLIPLIPNMEGKYKIPSPGEKRIILATGLHESVNKNG